MRVHESPCAHVQPCPTSFVPFANALAHPSSQNVVRSMQRLSLVAATDYFTVLRRNRRQETPLVRREWDKTLRTVRSAQYQTPNELRTHPHSVTPAKWEFCPVK